MLYCLPEGNNNFVQKLAIKLYGEKKCQAAVTEMPSSLKNINQTLSKPDPNPNKNASGNNVTPKTYIKRRDNGNISKTI